MEKANIIRQESSRKTTPAHGQDWLFSNNRACIGQRIPEERSS